MTNFEKAVALDNEKWLASLPDEIPEYEFSEKYNKFRVKLFDKMRGDKYHRFTKRATIAIIVAAILLSMTIVAIAATLGKDFILKHFDGYVVVNVSDKKDINDNVKSLNFLYIPDGFKMTDSDESDFGITYTYSLSDEWFYVSKTKINSDITYDEENGDVVKKELNGREYLVGSFNNSNSIMWNDGKFVFEINGTLSASELLRIAQQVQ